MFRVGTVIGAALCAWAAWAAGPGSYGFAIRTDLDGLWSPKISEARIEKVIENSATAKSGVVVGDVLLELDGMPVPGARGDALTKLKAVLDKEVQVGDQLSMKLRRANGDVYTVVLVAQQRPAGK